MSGVLGQVGLHYRLGEGAILEDVRHERTGDLSRIRIE
jgi:hypothetical protein